MKKKTPPVPNRFHCTDDKSEDKDYTPIAMPLGAAQPLTMAEEIQRFIRSALSEQAQETGEETFEEADDFEEDDDHTEFIGMTEYELTAMEAESGLGEPFTLEDPQTPSEAPQETITPPDTPQAQEGLETASETPPAAPVAN